MRVKPPVRTHTIVPHCGSHCHQLVSLRVFLTRHILVQATGSLSLSCRQPSGIGGTGRNCELAEVWLRKAGGGGVGMPA